MPLTPQEVASKVFGPTRMRRGYDENEVDAFLDQVEAELTRLHAENDRLKQELETARRGLGAVDGSGSVAEAELAPAGEAPSAPAPAQPVTSPQPAAAEVAPAAPDDAAVEQRVARMLVLAQQTADAAVRDAHAEAERLIAHARSRAADELNTLERDKAVLENEVEQLQAFEREYRQRLRAYLEMQLRELESRPGGPAAVGPSGSTPLEASSDASEPGLGFGAYDAMPDFTSGSRSDSGSGIGPDASLPASLEKTAEPAPDAPSLQVDDRDPLSSGLSDPPGFGQVWSPSLVGHADHFAAESSVADSREREGHAGNSPFDTGEGERTSGFGSGL